MSIIKNVFIGAILGFIFGLIWVYLASQFTSLEWGAIAILFYCTILCPVLFAIIWTVSYCINKTKNAFKYSLIIYSGIFLILLSHFAFSFGIRDAIQYSKKKQLKILLTFSFSHNLFYGSKKWLRLAVSIGDKEILQTLITAGIKPEFEKSTLLCQSLDKNTQIVKTLIDNGYNLGNSKDGYVFRCRTTLENSKFLTFYSKSSENANLSKYELQLFQELIRSNIDQKKIIDILKNIRNIDCKDLFLTTPLIIASAKNDTSLVNLFIEKGSSSNLINLLDYSALDWAIINKNTELIRILLKYNVDVSDYLLKKFMIIGDDEIFLFVLNQINKTHGNQDLIDKVLFEATWKRDVNKVKILLNLGANPSIRMTYPYPRNRSAKEWITYILQYGGASSSFNQPNKMINDLFEKYTNH